MKKSIAIITARGGSKRIFKKNIKLFCGKPIIAYSIKVALDSGIFDEVMVSTDDNEIAKVAIDFGAKVPFMRSEATSNDYATTADVIHEVLDMYRKSGMEFEVACCIYPTAPFITVEKLRRGMELLIQEDAETVMPVVAFSFPPQRGLYLRNDRLEPVQSDIQKMRSQDLEKIYHDCGQFYYFKTSSFLHNGVIIGEKCIPLEMDEMEVQDIDNEVDWKLAELKYSLMRKKDEI